MSEKNFRDWCPLCGKRFQADTADELCEQIMQHLKEDSDGKSECEKNWRPLDVAVKDDHY